jgi:hypothetical protein
LSIKEIIIEVFLCESTIHLTQERSCATISDRFRSQMPPNISASLELRFLESPNGAAGISAEMALRLSEALGTSPDLWLGMQTQYDLWRASKKDAAE